MYPVQFVDFGVMDPLFIVDPPTTISDAVASALYGDDRKQMKGWREFDLGKFAVSSIKVRVE